jgi:hypothetical protein
MSETAHAQQAIGRYTVAGPNQTYYGPFYSEIVTGPLESALGGIRLGRGSP